MLAQLAADSAALGAQEVFIGHPEDDGYEFFAKDKTFSGKLHPSIYQHFSEVLRDTPRKDIAVETNTLRSITLALTKSFRRPVVCLTWEKRQLAVVEPINGAQRKPSSKSLKEKRVR